MPIIRIGGQTLQEMSEVQLNRLLLETNKQKVKDEIVRLLQIKSRLRREEARNKHRADEDFVKDNF